MRHKEMLFLSTLCARLGHCVMRMGRWLHARAERVSVDGGLPRKQYKPGNDFTQQFMEVVMKLKPQ